MASSRRNASHNRLLELDKGLPVVPNNWFFYYLLIRLYNTLALTAEGVGLEPSFRQAPATFFENHSLRYLGQN